MDSGRLCAGYAASVFQGGYHTAGAEQSKNAYAGGLFRGLYRAYESGSRDQRKLI